MQAEDILKELVAISSWEKNELNLAQYIKNFLQNHSKKQPSHLILQSLEKERANLIAVWGKNPSLLWEAHLDTVPPGDLSKWKQPPLQLNLQNNKLMGLGTCDNKGNIALLLWVASLLPLKNIMFAFTAGEEQGHIGIDNLVNHPLLHSIKETLVMEPTSLRILTRHKGCSFLKIKVTGQQAHSALPKEGESAVMKAFSLFKKINQKAEEQGDLLNLGQILGGAAPNMIPGHCSLHCSYRFQNEKNFQNFSAYLETLTSKNNFSYAFHDTEPALTGKFVASQISKKLSQYCPEDKTQNYWTQASVFEQHQIKSLVWGCGHIQQAHSVNEYLSLSQLEKGQDIIQKVMLNYCQ